MTKKRQTLWGESGCPHGSSIWCPLSVAMNAAGLPNCDDGRLDQGGCAIDRGADYHQLLGALTTKDPRLVAECRWHEQLEQRAAQRERNLRLNGIH
jgi:hypothetical protein